MDAIIFHIQDDGIAIPQADQSHVFEPFYRAQNALKIQGTGLGLSVAKANVEMHGGSIAFDSQENLGTTFTVRLQITFQNSASNQSNGREFYAQENSHD